jgi:hypothetical protein
MLPVIVLLVMFSGPLARIPPPPSISSLEVAELPEMVLRVISAVLNESIPPPAIAELPEMVLPVRKRKPRL